ncbi:MAG: SDR family NAD(P)-dependent oxidoreductase [Dehalococcoidia bacterium]
MTNQLDVGPLSMEKSGLKRSALDGEVAVVTGAGHNIGLAVARSLAWLGAKVVVAEMSRQRGNEAAALINRENKPGTALFVETDVSNKASMKAMAQQAFDAFGRVDILVNNAMILTLMNKVMDAKVEDMDKQYAVATRGALIGIQAFVPEMLERHHGVVAYVSTMQLPGTYYATKAATSSLMLGLGSELGKVEDSGVSVFQFLPGQTGTPLGHEGISDRRPAAILQNVGYGRSIPAEDTGAALAYCIVHAPEIHNCGVTVFQVLKHMGWQFPRPDLVPRRDFDRLNERAVPVIFGYIGRGFAKPEDEAVSLNWSDFARRQTT